MSSLLNCENSVKILKSTWSFICRSWKAVRRDNSGITHRIVLARLLTSSLQQQANAKGKSLNKLSKDIGHRVFWGTAYSRMIRELIHRSKRWFSLISFWLLVCSHNKRCTKCSLRINFLKPDYYWMSKFMWAVPRVRGFYHPPQKMIEIQGVP